MEQTSQSLPRLTFGQAIASGFRNYATFSGRARRSEYWWWELFAFIIGLAAIIPYVGWILVLVIFLPDLAMTVRRLHDTNRSGYWLTGCFTLAMVATLALGMGKTIAQSSHPSGSITFLIVGWILYIAAIILRITMLYWCISDSDPEENDYGYSPKYMMPDEEE